MSPINAKIAVAMKNILIIKSCFLTGYHEQIFEGKTQIPLVDEI